MPTEDAGELPALVHELGQHPDESAESGEECQRADLYACPSSPDDAEREHECATDDRERIGRGLGVAGADDGVEPNENKASEHPEHIRNISRPWSGRYCPQGPSVAGPRGRSLTK